MVEEFQVSSMEWNGDKKIGLIRTYFVYSFYNIEKDEKIHLKNDEPLKVKKVATL